jgi:hypothetical protein
METTTDHWITQDEANRQAYAYHKDDVEREFDRIMIWIREKSACGLVSTDQIIITGKEVTKYLVVKLTNMRFRVSYEPCEKLNNNTFRLNIEWMWTF